ncbi:MAG: hypothetical protein KDB05_30165, partial [Planctomycetales bacterium]|nr:hypothetical protein [Planctomycetales bacterium]
VCGRTACTVRRAGSPAQPDFPTPIAREEEEVVVEPIHSVAIAIAATKKVAGLARLREAGMRPSLDLSI